MIWDSFSALLAFTAVSFALYGFDGVQQHLANLSWQGIIGILSLAYAASLIGYSGWDVLLSQHPAGKITPFALLVSVFALLAGYVVLDERLGIWHWPGIITVVCGLLLHIFGRRLILEYSKTK